MLPYRRSALDEPKVEGADNSNDGNSARRAFSEAGQFAARTELPDPEESEQARRLQEIVIHSIIHHECGHAHPTVACMENGRCSKGFPKPFSQQTEWRDDRLYPAYRRRAATDGGQEVMHRGRVITNQWVVPYSPFLSLKYACHINVELCCSVKSVKYLFKYVYKRHDHQMVRTDDPHL